MSHVTIDAPVKVNLHLGIHPGRDSRGYHRADSVMVALGVGDTVTVIIYRSGRQYTATLTLSEAKG